MKRTLISLAMVATTAITAGCIAPEPTMITAEETEHAVTTAFLRAVDADPEIRAMFNDEDALKSATGICASMDQQGHDVEAVVRRIVDAVRKDSENGHWSAEADGRTLSGFVGMATYAFCPHNL